ncbi:MAG: acetaldehyde dehydrogenase (acetylating), partial [Acidobacteria bacterium]
MYKIRRSEVLELTWMVGIVAESEGLRRARALGYRTTHRGIEELLEHAAEFELVFDATTARAHRRHAELLAAAGKVV